MNTRNFPEKKFKRQTRALTYLESKVSTPKILKEIEDIKSNLKTSIDHREIKTKKIGRSGDTKDKNIQNGILVRIKTWTPQRKRKTVVKNGKKKKTRKTIKQQKSVIEQILPKNTNLHDIKQKYTTDKQQCCVIYLGEL
jgi:hypothetical protein